MKTSKVELNKVKKEVKNVFMSKWFNAEDSVVDMIAITIIEEKKDVRKYISNMISIMPEYFEEYKTPLWHYYQDLIAGKGTSEELISKYNIVGDL